MPFTVDLNKVTGKKKTIEKFRTSIFGNNHGKVNSFRGVCECLVSGRETKMHDHQ